MPAAFERHLLETLVRNIDDGYRMVRAWPLGGGVSARTCAMEIATPDAGTRQMVVRVHGEADRRHNPHIARDEFRLLAHLHAGGLPVPRPVRVDESTLGAPAIVIEYLPGETVTAPLDQAAFVAEAATALYRIHTAAVADLSFLPAYSERIARLLESPGRDNEAFSGSAIRAALAGLWPLPRRNPDVLLHGDFWPGNLLWRGKTLVGVVDWEDAASGDPLADLANARLEMLMLLGREALERFTERYLELAVLDDTQLHGWDLAAALKMASAIEGWGLDRDRLAEMRTLHDGFVSRALAEAG